MYIEQLMLNAVTQHQATGAQVHTVHLTISI